jgi:hypothetical protein
MSNDLLLTDGDLTVTEQGDLVLATTKMKLARQWIEVRLKTILGEWFLDISDGTDWPDVLSKRNNKVLVDSTVKNIITESPYVVRLLGYNSTINKLTQKYDIEFAASIEDGEVLVVNNLEV